MTEDDWNRVESFTEEHVLTILRVVLETVEVRKKSTQLPQSPPVFLLWSWNDS